MVEGLYWDVLMGVIITQFERQSLGLPLGFRG